MTESNLKVYAFRLSPEDEITAKLVQFVRVNDIKAAFVMTCCGSVKCATLRFATPKGSAAGKEKIQMFDENFEICSLVGTVSQDAAHLHTTLGRADGSTLSGHVVDNFVVQTTAEVVLGDCSDAVFSRQFDWMTGFWELAVTKRQQQ